MVCYAAITGNTNVDVLIQQKSNGDLVQLPMMAGTLEHDSLNEKYVCYWFKSVYSSYMLLQEHNSNLLGIWFALIQIQIMWLLQNFAHDMAAVLPCHVQRFVLIKWLWME